MKRDGTMADALTVIVSGVIWFGLVFAFGVAGYVYVAERFGYLSATALVVASLISLIVQINVMNNVEFRPYKPKS